MKNKRNHMIGAQCLKLPHPVYIEAFPYDS